MALRACAQASQGCSAFGICPGPRAAPAGAAASATARSARRRSWRRASDRPAGRRASDAKIVRRVADALLRRRQAQRLAHRPVEPGPGSAACGQVPSLSEPRITTSACCRRASKDPRWRCADAWARAGGCSCRQPGCDRNRGSRRPDVGRGRSSSMRPAKNLCRPLAGLALPQRAASSLRRPGQRLGGSEVRRGERLQAAPWPTMRKLGQSARSRARGAQQLARRLPVGGRGAAPRGGARTAPAPAAPSAASTPSRPLPK